MKKEYWKTIYISDVFNPTITLKHNLEKTLKLI